MNKAFTIGVDLGGTNLRIAAAYCGDHVFMDEISLDTGLARGRDHVIHDLCSGIRTLLARHEREGKVCAGIAVGSPGPLELPAGILRNPPNLRELNNFPLLDTIERELGRPVLLEGDGNVAALGELHAGAGSGFDAGSLCMLTLGTGVGNGLVMQGKIWQGMTGMAGEGGHIVVEPDGHPCGCGGRGCLEQYASATAIARMGAEMGLGQHSAQFLAELAAAGNPRAIELYERVGRWLALALCALINVLNFPLYVIGGGVCHAWQLFAPSLDRHLRELSYVYRLTVDDPRPGARTSILPAVLGSKAGLLGACLAPLTDERYQRRLAQQFSGAR